jgi:hypothetical protein
MDARKRIAAGEARPFKEQWAVKNQGAAQCYERLKDLKKDQPRAEVAIAEAEAQVTALTRKRPIWPPRPRRSKTPFTTSKPSIPQKTGSR